MQRKKTRKSRKFKKGWSLQKFFDKTKVKKSHFANETGIGKTNIYPILTQRYNMRLSKALKICHATGWKVLPQDLLKEELWNI